jgi:dienelactone hydrolase
MHRPVLHALLSILIHVAIFREAPAQIPGEPVADFGIFVRQQGAALRHQDQPPQTLADWHAQQTRLRSDLLKAWGGFPETPCPLDAQVLGSFTREGYRVERIIFQTMTDIRMTANAYVPENQDGLQPDSRLPAVLCVHGHWPGAKQDPVVQSRCIGLAKLGFFVLCVDAFGAGERAIEEKLGEYHGEMTGAMLLPPGRPLSGIQVYENMRAVDYLISRKEVDAGRIGITGASGGGNQTMYAGGYDTRFRCIVPTCSVGTYQSYLSAACCMCEVVPGGLTFTEEGNILGLSSGRGLMITSATKDAFQFSVDQAKISVERARQISELVQGGEVRHTIIESPHHYNQPMREAMYGWMTGHLKGQGDGSPIPEPEVQVEDPEVLRCFPGDSRPDDFNTIPRFAYRLSQEVLAEHDRTNNFSISPESTTTIRDYTESFQVQGRRRLQSVLGLQNAPTTVSEPSDLKLSIEADQVSEHTEFSLEPEPGIRLTVLTDQTPLSSDESLKKPTPSIALLIDLDQGAETIFNSDTADNLRKLGWRVAAPELRATGRFRIPSDRIGNAPDHNSAEWAMWIGRPLLGQWVLDIRKSLDALTTRSGTNAPNFAIVGFGSAGVVALSAAALDDRISTAVTVRSLCSYVSRSPYRNQHLGIMVPGILPAVGDIPHITALIAPRTTIIVDGTTATGQPVSAEDITASFKTTVQRYSAYGAESQLKIISMTDLQKVLLNPD